VTEWRQHAPWPTDVQVEQDLVICRALVEMFRRPEIAEALMFRGGTAIYKLHLRPGHRYSEDIDLVQVRPEPIGPILTALRGTLDPWLGSPKRSFGEGRVALTYRVMSEGPPAVPMRLKVEINSREHFSVHAVERHRFEVHSRWFSGESFIPTFCLDELLGTKLRALYQRRKSRDLFDLWIALHQGRASAEAIVQCFLEYMRRAGTRISRAEFEANFSAKLLDPIFTQDLTPLLAPGIDWNLEEAGAQIHQTLISKLPGQPWKGPASPVPG
jgi:predicted nucleotidyltransferase component of viral defense system